MNLRAWPSAKHLTSWLCLAPGNKISGRKEEIIQPGSSAVAVGGHDYRAERYGARSILSRLSSRAGKAKAVTATARKIAVLFYNTLSHGMIYRDPGADHYEEQYRSRVLANLKRRAK
ncbi:hypothetical protein [Mesorhizobium sp.]|uniref:hypothetical protein n=1 Tax=Mesorhizobium sp. TaxID=1871066 RepID=UPI0025BAD750|nr:hypothetical protein [Mesorhizobium sp.]